MEDALRLGHAALRSNRSIDRLAFWPEVGTRRHLWLVERLHSALVCDGFKLLRQGQEVEYDMHSTSKGLQALVVRPLERDRTIAALQV
jgi:hypothetical protein